MGLPGPPQRTELAYLAALVDRSGGFCASQQSATIAIKLSAPPELRQWLLLRFGGHQSQTSWILGRQADLHYVATGIAPFLVVKRRAGAAFVELLEHCARRPSYHGSADWRAERDRLKAEVRRSSAAPVPPARGARA